MTDVVIGSRESRLAMMQSNLVRDYIREKNPGLRVEILSMKTTGDIILDRTLDQIGGKGLFVKELDKALLDGRSHLTVHSMKDVPAEVPDELPLIAFSRREDPRDVLVLPEGKTELDPEKPIGSSSRRRVLQLQKLYPDMAFASVRGNLQTRLRKLDEGEYSALVLAAAGLKRLGLSHRISRYFSLEEVIPSAGQGILAVQGRKGEDYAYLAGFEDTEARDCVLAERAYIRQLDGGCSSPIAAHGEIRDGRLFLRALYYEEETGITVTGTLEGNRADAEALGRALAARLRREAGEMIDAGQENKE